MAYINLLNELLDMAVKMILIHIFKQKNYQTFFFFFFWELKTYLWSESCNGVSIVFFSVYFDTFCSSFIFVCNTIKQWRLGRCRHHVSVYDWDFLSAFSFHHFIYETVQSRKLVQNHFVLFVVNAACLFPLLFRWHG